jgi:SAM-dependent methyltransferase
MTQSNISEVPDLRVWEEAEIKRSAFEAAHRRQTDEALRFSESNIARYLDPPADTCFPLEYAYHLLGDVRGRKVVDFGCGTGEDSVMLARRGALVEAVDISADLIEIARRRLTVNHITSGVRFHAASVYELPFEDESMDVVFGMAVLHHLDLALAAREVKRVLRPGGRAIFEEPMRDSKVLKFLRSLIPYESPDVSPFERPLTHDELREFASGFTLARSRDFRLPYQGLAMLLPVLRNYEKELLQFDDQLLQRFPALRYYATVRVFEMVK